MYGWAPLSDEPSIEADRTSQQLGDCLGKGAFGSVYRALNWNTGETVAVKQIKLTDLPKSELRVIMVM
jgi:serine/threonine protein kinase